MYRSQQPVDGAGDQPRMQFRTRLRFVSKTVAQLTMGRCQSEGKRQPKRQGSCRGNQMVDDTGAGDIPEPTCCQALILHFPPEARRWEACLLPNASSVPERA